MKKRLDKYRDINTDQFSSQFGLAESLSIVERHELLSLLNSCYPHWTIENIFENYFSYESLYIYRLHNSDGALIASRQILIIDNPDYAPIWASNISDKLSLYRFAIGSRAIVHPDLRGYGLGTKLVQEANNFAYENYNLNAILGSSTSLSAIKLYLRLGANLWDEDITTYNMYNTTYYQNKDCRISNPLRYIYLPSSLNYDKKNIVHSSQTQHSLNQQYIHK